MQRYSDALILDQKLTEERYLKLMSEVSEIHADIALMKEQILSSEAAHAATEYHPETAGAAVESRIQDKRDTLAELKATDDLKMLERMVLVGHLTNLGTRLE